MEYGYGYGEFMYEILSCMLKGEVHEHIFNEDFFTVRLDEYKIMCITARKPWVFTLLLNLFQGMKAVKVCWLEKQH